MNISWQGIAILVVALVLIFGFVEIPAIARSMHRAFAEFREHGRNAPPAREHPEDIP